MTGVRHRDDASQRPAAMSTGHFAPVAASAIVGGETAFSPGRVGDGKQGKDKASTSIHGKISRRPGNKAAETVQSNRGESLSLQRRGRAPASRSLNSMAPIPCSNSRRDPPAVKAGHSMSEARAVQRFWYGWKM